MAAANKGAPLLGWQVAGATHKQRSGFRSLSGRRLLSLFPSDSARATGERINYCCCPPASQPMDDSQLAIATEPSRAELQFERARWRHLSLATAEGTFLAARASDAAGRPTLKPPLGA